MDIDEIVTDLLNYAFDHGIALIMTRQLSPHAPSAVDTFSKRIIFNMNMYDRKQMPLQLAHDIKHIENGDESTQLLYFTQSKAKMEFRANVGAIDMLLPFYIDEKEPQQINIYNFMDCFSIPSHLEEAVTEAIRNY